MFLCLGIKIGEPLGVLGLYKADKKCVLFVSHTSYLVLYSGTYFTYSLKSLLLFYFFVCILLHYLSIFVGLVYGHGFIRVLAGPKMQKKMDAIKHTISSLWGR